MSDSYEAMTLPLRAGTINPLQFLDELIDATARLEVYREKIHDSKLNSSWFMPTLQQKEALASSALEGTQATLDGVLTNQIAPNDKDRNLNEVQNYYRATLDGYRMLRSHDFTHDFFWRIHTTLMTGNVRKPDVIGAYRTKQNYIGRNDSAVITFTPPVAEKVYALMDNLISYINEPQDQLRPLVRTAIIHAQFETIHPFMDGNGRVGRMLIPMYLFAKKQIDLPCFFISEALEHDKLRYYSLLNNIRYKGEWDEWIKFFLATVAAQCNKYIRIISDINDLHDRHIEVAKNLVRSPNIEDVINALYETPITTAKTVAAKTGLPPATINRYLSLLVDQGLLSTNNQSRYRTFYYFELLDILHS